MDCPNNDDNNGVVAENGEISNSNGSSAQEVTGADTYNSIFPALPDSGTVENGTENMGSEKNHPKKLRINASETTQVFCIPADERKHDNSDKFGESESVRICQQIMKETGAQIEISTSKDKSLTFLITGKPYNVLEARRKALNSFQTQVNVSISVPKDHHRSILGKSGEKLKTLEKSTATKISIPAINDASEDITITGTRDGIERAMHEIKIISDERSKKTFVRLQIPKKFHPFICGPNNEKVNKLMKKTGTRINVPPPSVHKDEITITGEKKGVETAEQFITKIHKDTEANHQVVNVEIPKLKHKYIIGPKRTGIAEILQKTGISIDVPSIEDAHETVTLHGPQSNISEALKLIFEKANSMRTELIDLPAYYHRYVIGKKGCNIREVQEVYNELHVEFFDDKVKIEAPSKNFEDVRTMMLQKIKYYIDNYKFEEIPIDPKLLKHIIGKNGANVNKFKAEYDINIIIPDNPDKKRDVIRVEGSKLNVTRAEVVR